MSPQPRRDTTAGQVYNDLRNLARRQGRATDGLLQLYLLERFLHRLVHSSASGKLILKGGTLLAAYQLRRATQDIDVQASSLANDEDTLAEVVRGVCQVQADDGVSFDLAGLTVTTIREGAAHEGLRARLPAAIGPAQLVLRLDVNFGDPITPAPTTVAYPQLLGGSFEVRGYPLVTVLAEKLVTMIDLADANTRDRDVGDVYRIIHTHAVDGDELHAACHATGHLPAGTPGAPLWSAHRPRSAPAGALDAVANPHRADRRTPRGVRRRPRLRALLRRPTTRR